MKYQMRGSLGLMGILVPVLTLGTFSAQVSHAGATAEVVEITEVAEKAVEVTRASQVGQGLAAAQKTYDFNKQSWFVWNFLTNERNAADRMYESLLAETPGLDWDEAWEHMDTKEQITKNLYPVRDEFAKNIRAAVASGRMSRPDAVELIRKWNLNTNTRAMEDAPKDIQAAAKGLNIDPDKTLARIRVISAGDAQATLAKIRNFRQTLGPENQAEGTAVSTVAPGFIPAQVQATDGTATRAPGMTAVLALP